MGKYDDMLHLPHHVSQRYPPMSMHDRAAQFSPFAALTGYASVIRETARLTDRKIHLDADEQAVLNERLRIIADHISQKCVVSVTYFRSDAKKEGGAYLTVTGMVRKVKEYESLLVMENGADIPFSDILALEGELFPDMP